MSAPLSAPSSGPRSGPRTRLAIRGVFAALVAVSLLMGMAAGLVRAGIEPAPGLGPLWGRAAALHAALMMGGFLGTVISIERAVALKHRLAFVAPMASGLAGLTLLLGQADLGAGLLVLAALAFVGVNAVIFRRQPAAHTLLLLVSALAWLAGNLRWAWHRGSSDVLAWWFVFLVLTIAAERLEMTRLMRHRPQVQNWLFAIVAGLTAGAALSGPWPHAGGLVLGAALTSLAVWLGRFDIARRTVAAAGLSRYMALCLLSGYAWLGLGGLAWMATAAGLPQARDTALHALALGFVISMVMGHAPVILPAVAGIKLRFGWFFYVPLALLHGSLALRLVGGWLAWRWHAWGVQLNVVAIVLFAITVAVSAALWRRAQARTASRRRGLRAR